MREERRREQSLGRTKTMGGSSVRGINIGILLYELHISHAKSDIPMPEIDKMHLIIAWCLPYSASLCTCGPYDPPCSQFLRYLI